MSGWAGFTGGLAWGGGEQGSFCSVCRRSELPSVCCCLFSSRWWESGASARSTVTSLSLWMWWCARRASSISAPSALIGEFTVCFAPRSPTPRVRRPSRWLSNGNLYLLNYGGKVPFFCRPHAFNVPLWVWETGRVTQARIEKLSAIKASDARCTLPNLLVFSKRDVHIHYIIIHLHYFIHNCIPSFFPPLVKIKITLNALVGRNS